MDISISFTLNAISHKDLSTLLPRYILLIQYLLPVAVATASVQAFIICCLDHCHHLPTSPSASSWASLQFIIYALAKMILIKCNLDNVSPLSKIFQ